MITIIRFYKILISPTINYLTATKNVCRFSPTCSEYTEEAIRKYGALKGVWMGIKRVFSCNPWLPADN